MGTGRLYDANYDTELIAERQACKELCYTLNHLPPSQIAEREAIIRRLFCKTKERFLLEQPFYCDYGYNIEIGENFYANMNCVILDEAKVTLSLSLHPVASIPRVILWMWNREIEGWNMPVPFVSEIMCGLGHKCAYYRA